MWWICCDLIYVLWRLHSISNLPRYIYLERLPLPVQPNTPELPDNLHDLTRPSESSSLPDS
ncbi:hypothetical protein BDZ89DRAFT_1068290 [Hymenopellis radicata]|nr:hypothetical protein BDZ89DRAFT_1068290 [Hymenopellis radicata]